uniref:Uncharacterized protein n=1 Tax=Vespula pensylvanica TaxID=30213 RepID=A0A834NZ51_VESPE|nr:hypothetical protein H0235_009723 [Vespula pensylvanica]
MDHNVLKNQFDYYDESRSVVCRIGHKLTSETAADVGYDRIPAICKFYPFDTVTGEAPGKQEILQLGLTDNIRIFQYPPVLTPPQPPPPSPPSRPPPSSNSSFLRILSQRVKVVHIEELLS